MLGSSLGWIDEGTTQLYIYWSVDKATKVMNLIANIESVANMTT